MQNRISEKLKAELLNSIPLPIAFYSPAHEIVWANTAYLEASRHTSKNINAQKCFEIWGLGSPCSSCPVLNPAAAKGNAERYNSKYKSAKNSDIYWRSHCVPIKNGNGESIGILETSFEITKEIEVEQSLKQSEALLKEAQQLAKLGSWELDLRKNHLEWSDQVYRIFEMDPASFGASYEAFIETIHPEDKASVDYAYTASLKSGTPYSISHRLKLKDNRIKYVHNRCKTVYDKDGNPVRSIGTVQDITQRKVAEIEYKKLRNQYNQSQKMESIAHLAGAVAHDFNNMLFVIQGNMEILLGREELDQSVRSHLKEVLAAAEKSADLTRQLLAFARKQEIKPRELNINTIIEKMLKLLKRLIGENISLIWKPAPEPGIVKMDPAQIDQILANLCVNSRDAISDIGSIIIETKNVAISKEYCNEHPGFSPGNYVMLAVSDTGCGMTPEVSAKLFEPFFTTKGEEKGTGLGLATVYGIIKQNGGFVNLYSEPGNGTTFRVYFPVYDAGAIEPAETEPETLPEGNGEIILMVEDELAILRTGQKMLESLGYKVVTVANPIEALSVAMKHSGEIDLLISDIVMPEMNGPDLAAALTTTWPDLKTLFISGYTSEAIVGQGLLNKPFAFLGKPFSQKEIALKIAGLLGSRSKPFEYSHRDR